MPRARTAAIAGVVVLALSITGCTASEPMPATSDTAMIADATDAATPSPVPPSGDGVLRVGTLLVTGAAPQAERAEVSGVEVAIREINNGGGVAGVPVEVLHRNPGQSVDTASSAIADLVRRGIDVIVTVSSSPQLPVIQTEAATANITVIVVPEATRASAGARAGADPRTPDVLFTARLTDLEPALRDLSPSEVAAGASSYNATVMAALAATVSADDGGPSIAQGLIAITASGIPCSSFGECLNVLTTEPAIEFGRAGIAATFSETSDASGYFLLTE